MIISIILAAGEGKRMKSKIPKVLHKMCGKPLLSYVIKASEAAGINKNVIIISNGSKDLVESVKDETVIFKEQPVGENVPYGTGFAVMQGKDYIKDDDYVVILYGDTPLIKGDTLKDLVKYHIEKENQGTVLTAFFENPTGYGRILYDEKGELLKIVEEKDADEEEKKIKEINSGMYCFNGKALRESLDKIHRDNAQGEYYITDVIEILKRENLRVGVYRAQDNTEIFGVNSKVQLAQADMIMRKRVNEKLMEQGVIIINPGNTYIESGVKIGEDTMIYPGTFLEGNTEIGENCIIGHDSRIVDSKIEDEVEIQSSTIIESTVGNNSTIGPYAYLRPNSHIGKNVKIGDFVEVKNSTIGDYSKASHLSYIGDATVGKKVNVGCGVVFVNYNGKIKQRTLVGDNAFIGSNSNLVAPVKVEKWGYIAAGSTITDAVNEYDLSIARARQVNKKDWVIKKGFVKDNK
ncbi:bifunctional UDP-N-acetylglucosamine diphosphorylase/glucosamine-1-phosphate N-acetyltransferase GlmU [Acidilutibacter cellobiosedens]|uniref:Bifunctional protein GlmU n=1 Tax=Acidilutibacter cellobiosedens TaxID=2507161 RepID=A0A410QFI9_9FIRM|nr:bifunctional UDP-N-acetylglucosamine diphosphorylase/glucosamine-1-phosphate N-acetyltransferase GlmU [Acidilutibacter cellobiosedens]QAT62771.1 bifunctional UDP-N-acetylglucosamine diphosphorylase/glucosamine-1-phosphate N-acetyltransferase GlmU [Acidilutibacter cellobiosedens]